MKTFITGNTMISPGVLLIFLLIVVIGYVLVHIIANRKWGYTSKREKELEKQLDQFIKEKKK